MSQIMNERNGCLRDTAPGVQSGARLGLAFEGGRVGARVLQ